MRDDGYLNYISFTFARTFRQHCQQQQVRSLLILLLERLRPCALCCGLRVGFICQLQSCGLSLC